MKLQGGDLWAEVEMEREGGPALQKARSIFSAKNVQSTTFLNFTPAVQNKWWTRHRSQVSQVIKRNLWSDEVTTCLNFTPPCSRSKQMVDKSQGDLMICNKVTKGTHYVHKNMYLSHCARTHCEAYLHPQDAIFHICVKLFGNVLFVLVSKFFSSHYHSCLTFWYSRWVGGVRKE